jgi:hypothetical protein
MTTIAYVAQAEFSASGITTNPSVTTAFTLVAGDGVEVHILANSAQQPTSVQDGVTGNTYTYKGASAVGGAYQLYTYVCQNANAGTATVAVTGAHIFAVYAKQIRGGTASGLTVVGPVSAYVSGPGTGANIASSGNAAVGSTAINVLVSGFNVNLQNNGPVATAGTSPLAFTAHTAVWANLNGTAYSVSEDLRIAGATGNIAATFGISGNAQYDNMFTVVMVYQEAASVVSYNETIKAIAVVSGYATSVVASAAYTITNPT